MSDEDLANVFQNFARDTNISEENQARKDYAEHVLVNKRGWDISVSDGDVFLGPPPSVLDVNEKFFKNDEKLIKYLKFTPNALDGPKSKRLVEGLKKTPTKNETGGWSFEGRTVLIERGKGVAKGEYSETKDKNQYSVVNLTVFRQVVEFAREENAKTFEGMTERKVATFLEGVVPPSDVTESVASNSMETVVEVISEKVEELTEEAKTINLSEEDVREFAGIFQDLAGDSGANIDAMEANGDHFRVKALNESDPLKETFYKGVTEACYLKADQMRMKDGLKPEHEEANSIINEEIENNDLTRLEKFKKWAKENMLGLSAVGITVAGIITTIAVGARGAVKAGAHAVGALGKMLAKVAKSLGPMLAPLLGLLANVISWGAKGLLWLSQNLWVLAIAVTYFVYDYWIKNKR